MQDLNFERRGGSPRETARVFETGDKLAKSRPVLTPCTAEQVWTDSLNCITEWNPEHAPTVIVVPHPDDETLGSGV